MSRNRLVRSINVNQTVIILLQLQGEIKCLIFHRILCCCNQQQTDNRNVKSALYWTMESKIFNRIVTMLDSQLDGSNKRWTMMYCTVQCDKLHFRASKHGQRSISLFKWRRSSRNWFLKLLMVREEIIPRGHYYCYCCGVIESTLYRQASLLPTIECFQTTCTTILNFICKVRWGSRSQIDDTWLIDCITCLLLIFRPLLHF